MSGDVPSLTGAIQLYDWGKRGNDGLAANIAFANSAVKLLSPNKTYAEFWLGTHPSGPARVVDPPMELKQYIQQNGLLSSTVQAAYGDGLPFMAKVLSINKALSIQAHPDKGRAEQLHAEKPDIYKDPNHKPEIAIALTDFTTLCGFRDGADIVKTLKEYSALTKAAGKDAVKALKKAVDNKKASAMEVGEALKTVFENMVKAEDKYDEEDLVEQLVAELEIKHAKGSLDPNEDVALTLQEQHPGDYGIVLSMIMNVVSLTPGQALFIQPNVPHCYVSGDIFEVMASSDNVVRAGLTSKHKDIDLLVDMLNYGHSGLESVMLKSVSISQWVERYEPPIREYAVERIQMHKEDLIRMMTGTGLSVVLITSGQGFLYPNGQVEDPDTAIALVTGTALLIPPQKTFDLESTSNLSLFRVYCDQ
eukprot:Clim_evm8s66 gene=Clim_evmTU8s66